MNKYLIKISTRYKKKVGRYLKYYRKQHFIKMYLKKYPIPQKVLKYIYLNTLQLTGWGTL